MKFSGKTSNGSQAYMVCKPLGGSKIECKAASKPESKPQFINVYVFGDSHTDPGNLPYETSPGNSVPFNYDRVLGPL